MRVYTGVVVSVLVALCAAVGGAPPDPDKLATSIEDLLSPPELALPGQPQANACQRYPLLVNFADLGWNDVLVVPHEYDAGYCAGSCLPDSLPNSTNHAIVQARLHNIHNNVPKPCCVPTELEPLTVIYASQNNVVLRDYFENMQVKSCGCH